MISNTLVVIVEVVRGGTVGIGVGVVAAVLL
jgi:hypothetical protein